eukprot:4926784-Prymnesium_polylepis.1
MHDVGRQVIPERRNRDKFMVAADATVRAAHSRQTASRHRVLDSNALASRDSRLVTRQLRGAARPEFDSELRSRTQQNFR